MNCDGALKTRYPGDADERTFWSLSRPARAVALPREVMAMLWVMRVPARAGRPE